MKFSTWLLPMMTLGAQAQSTVTYCENYSYTGTVTFVEFKTYYVTGDGFGLPEGTSTTVSSNTNGGNATPTSSRTTSNNYAGDGGDASRSPTTSSRTTSMSVSTSSAAGTSSSSSSPSVSNSSGFTTSMTGSTASTRSSNSVSTTTSVSNTSSQGTTTSTSSISNGASTTTRTTSTSTLTNGGESTSSSSSVTSNTSSSSSADGGSTTSTGSQTVSTTSTTSTPLPTCLAALPGDCADLTNTDGVELQGLVPICLAALGLQVEVNLAALDCLQVDLITDVTLGVDIVDCLDDSLLCVDTGSSTTTTLTTTSTSSTSTSTDQGTTTTTSNTQTTTTTTTTTTTQSTTTSTTTTDQGSTTTTSSVTATTTTPAPTCGSAGCPNGSGVLNVSTDRTLAECKTLCDAGLGKAVGCVAIQFDPSDGACTLLSLPILQAIDLGSTEVCATLVYDDSCDVSPDPSPDTVDGGFEDVADADLGSGPKTAGGWTLNNDNVFFSENADQPVACVNALPATCTQLGGINGLALIPLVAQCQTSLGSNANPDTTTCLATSAVNIFTTGQGIVNCLSAAALCPRGAQYSTIYGTKFVTVEGNAGTISSFQQTLNNVPTGLDNQNTITYSYNYDQTGDVTALLRCTINVFYAGSSIDTFVLSVLDPGWQTRRADFFAGAATGDLVFQLDCSAKPSSYDDVLFDEISVTSTPIMSPPAP